MNDREKPKGKEWGWKIKTPSVVFTNPYFQVRNDQVQVASGNEITYSYLDHPGSVFVVPITAEGRIVLIRSYRYPVDSLVWGIPCGSISDKSQLSLEEVARTELKEEAGVVGGELCRLTEFCTAPGVMSLRSVAFVAKGVRLEQRQPEEGELILEVVEKTPNEVRQMILSGDLWDAESAFLVLLAMSMGRL